MTHPARRRLRTLAATAATALLAVGGSAVATADPAGSAAPTVSRSGAGWVLSTTDASKNYAPTFIGNGYLAARIPAGGAGFSSKPITTQASVAGFYASSSPDAGETRASLPTWTTLGVGDGSSVNGATQPQPCGFDTLCPAPYGTLSGGAVLAGDHSGSTSGQFVAGFATSSLAPNVGATASVVVHGAPAGAAKVAVRYANSSGDTQTGSVVVGGATTQITLPSLPSWDTWGVVSVPVTLAAGDDTVAVTTASGDTGQFNLDAVAAYPTDGTVPSKTIPCGFDTLCPAPYGTLSGGAVLASDHSGSTSGQFVAGFATSSLAPNVGATATVTVHGAPAGAAKVAVRYANSTGDSQTASVVVGGTTTQITLPSLPSWDTWGVVSVPVSLAAGDDTVAVTTASGDTGRFNLDAVAAYPADGSVPTTSAGDGDTISGYRQSLDMRTGALTTSYDWTSPAGRTTHLVYTANANQGVTHLGTVHVALTPRWSGTATVYDQFDGRGLDHASTERVGVNGPAATLTENVVTTGRLVTATMASALRVDGRTVRTTATDDLAGGTAGQQAAFTVRADHTYDVTKYVGIASSVDTDRNLRWAAPRTVAIAAASSAARSGYATVVSRNDTAWARLWKSDISVPGDAALTASVRAAMFYLLESVRAGVNWSTSPGGLSSDGYNGHVFWDADTWMYPGLLAMHPSTANSMNTYRQQRLAAARKMAKYEGLQGAKYPWESGLTGVESIPPGNPEGAYENHINSDIALAQWQYYLASGDLTWLRTHAYPVIKGVADYWASRAIAESDGSYSIDDVQGPDEYHVPVNNEAYTNVSARTALTIASTAARLVGAKADAAWTRVADHLTMPKADPALGGAYPEYDGYTAGTQVKQADVTMLQYPWQHPMSRSTEIANLEYYGRNTDVGGPSMTDSVAAINSARLGVGCSAYTYLLRSSTPFLTTPFDQMRETRTGGAFTFTTAEGGYLQEFLYGFTGMTLGQKSVALDPSLPAQLPGVDLTGLHWQGRTFDVHIRPDETVVSLTAGRPLPVTAAGTTKTVARGKSLRLRTRRLGASTTADRAQCTDATATSADPSYPAVAAVDGAKTTAWHATAPGASLTLDLGVERTLRKITVQSDGATTAYTIQSSTNGTTWTTIGTRDATSASVTVLDAAPFGARYLRYVAGSDATAEVVGLTAA